MNLYRVRFNLTRSGEVVDEEMNVVADNLIQAVAYATSRRNDLRHSAVFKELDLRDVVLVVERVEVAK